MNPPPVIAAEAARGCEDCPASGGEAVLLQQIVKRRAADPEQFRRARDIILGPAHRLADGLAVGDLARRAKVDRKNVVARNDTRLEIEVASTEALPVRHDHRAL